MTVMPYAPCTVSTTDVVMDDVVHVLVHEILNEEADLRHQSETVRNVQRTGMFLGQQRLFQ